MLQYIHSNQICPAILIACVANKTTFETKSAGSAAGLC